MTVDKVNHCEFRSLFYIRIQIQLTKQYRLQLRKSAKKAVKNDTGICFKVRTQNRKVWIHNILLVMLILSKTYTALTLLTDFSIIVQVRILNFCKNLVNTSDTQPLFSCRPSQNLKSESLKVLNKH